MQGGKHKECKGVEEQTVLHMYCMQESLEGVYLMFAWYHTRIPPREPPSLMWRHILVSIPRSLLFFPCLPPFLLPLPLTTLAR